jgi:hypothetical protein
LAYSSAIRVSMAACDSRVKGRNKQRSSSDRDEESSDIAACVGSVESVSCLVDTGCKSGLLTLRGAQAVDSREDDDGDGDGGQLL